MTDNPYDGRVVPVTVVNSSDMAPAKPLLVAKTTVRTVVLDSTGAIGPTFMSICDYEPKRIRLVIEAIDQPIAVCTEVPVKTPDTSSATNAPQGRHLDKASASPVHEFFGPDAFWINTVTAGTTRVTVTREFKD